MSLVRKNKKIILLFLLSHFSLFASMTTEEISFYYYTNHPLEVKEKTLQLLTNSDDSNEKATALYYLAMINDSYKDLFFKEVQNIKDPCMLGYFYILKKDKMRAKHFIYSAIAQIDDEIKNIFDSRTWYNSKSVALHELKLAKRILQSDLALFLMENEEKEEALTLLNASKGKKNDLELKNTLEKLQKSIKPPQRGKIGWTLEGFASLQNAKELFVLQNYFQYNTQLKVEP